MRFDGILIKWNDERGFGFIAPRLGGQEIFIHISSFPRDGRRPGDPKGNRMAAINIRCLDNIDLASIPVQNFDGRSM